jgi:SPP1 family predicted phage head-tail adaptor
MNAGNLNRRIQILVYTGFIDSKGYEQERWEPLIDCWANIKNISGREVFKSGKEINLMTSIFTVRYNSKIMDHNTSQMIVSFEDKKYNVRHVNNIDMAYTYIELTGELIRDGS